jgi:hypothetical protein
MPRVSATFAVNTEHAKFSLTLKISEDSYNVHTMSIQCI